MGVDIIPRGTGLINILLALVDNNAPLLAFQAVLICIKCFQQYVVNHIDQLNNFLTMLLLRCCYATFIEKAYIEI